MASPLVPPGGSPPADRRPRLSPFERVQLLLVLWVALADPVRGGAGLTFLPVTADRIPTVSAAELLLRMVNAAAYPLVAFAITRRFPLWQRPARHAVFHAAALALLHTGGWAMTRVEPGLGFGWPFYLHRTFEFVVYAVFAHGMRFGERHHQKEREELRLRAVVAESTADRVRAQVRALRMDWSPRFLTGTLESIGGLLARDGARAKRMLLGLSGVLRRTLAHARSDTVRLEQEVEFVREVLGVEALRRPRLQVDWKVDEGALELPVPHMSLVTLVYQALPEDVDAPARIRLFAAPAAAGVLLRVDARGAAAEGPAGEGDALRLERLCEIEASAPGAGERSPRATTDEAGRARRAGGTDGAGGMDETGGARGAAEGEEPALGRRLETGTYAAFLVFYLLLTLYTADARVASGRAVLAAPAWVYVAGSGVYAALWWGSLVTAARRLSARFPVRQARWPSRLAIHAGGAVLVALVNAVAYFPFQRYVVRGGSISIGFRSYWEWGDLTVYPLLAGIAHGFIYAREYHARRLSELRLRSQLSESDLSRRRAELQALKAELNPHFLFNALNTVSALMYTRVDEARRVVGHLAALLRRMLQSAGLHEVTVEQEVEFTCLYMEIERVRFGDALRMEYHVEPATRRARVPHLLVQPLVENAVKHGLRPRDGTGHVVLTTRREGDVLEVTVDDDGVGPGHGAAAEGTGTGLANVRRRLRQLYGEAHVFEVAAGPAGGTRARIRIPFAEGPRAPDPADTLAAQDA